MITLSCFHTQDGQWSRKKSRKVIFIISTITIDLQSHGDENDKQFSPGPTPGREHQHTFNKTSNSISSMIWIAPTAMARWSMQRHRKYHVLSWQTLSINKVTTHRSWSWCLYSTRSHAALWAADLDWIVGPRYSLGWVLSGKKPWKTNLEPWNTMETNQKPWKTMKLP